MTNGRQCARARRQGGEAKAGLAPARVWKSRVRRGVACFLCRADRSSHRAASSEVALCLRHALLQCENSDMRSTLRPFRVTYGASRTGSRVMRIVRPSPSATAPGMRFVARMPGACAARMFHATIPPAIGAAAPPYHGVVPPRMSAETGGGGGGERPANVARAPWGRVLYDRWS